MIGRLVEQENVRARSERLGQGGAAGFAAGQDFGIFQPGQAEMFQQVLGAIGIIAAGQAGLDIRHHRLEFRQVGILLEIADRRAGMDEAFAFVGLDCAGGDFHQRRLARAIAADQAQAFALANAEISAVEQGGDAEGEVDILEREKRWSHEAPHTGPRDEGHGPRSGRRAEKPNPSKK